MYKKLLLITGLLAILPSQSMDLGAWQKLKNRTTSLPWADDLAKTRTDVQRPNWLSRILLNKTSVPILVSLAGQFLEKENEAYYIGKNGDFSKFYEDAKVEYYTKKTLLMSLSFSRLFLYRLEDIYPKTNLSRLPYGAQQFAKINIKEQQERSCTSSIWGVRHIPILCNMLSLRNIMWFSINLGRSLEQTNEKTLKIDETEPTFAAILDGCSSVFANRVDTAFYPHDDKKTVEQMTCKKCLHQAASVVPRLNSKEGRTWHKDGHLCREELEIEAGKKTDVCEFHKKPATPEFQQKWWQKLWRK